MFRFLRGFIQFCFCVWFISIIPEKYILLLVLYMPLDLLSSLGKPLDAGDRRGGGRHYPAHIPAVPLWEIPLGHCQLSDRRGDQNAGRQDYLAEQDG